MHQDKQFKNDFEETDLNAHVVVPRDGGWGWVVVIASFFIMFVQTGLYLSFGAIANDIGSYFQVSASAVALINSIQTALNFMISPLSAAFINRYGFRACGMFGGVTGAISILIGSQSPTYTLLLIFYGILYGFSASFMNMASLLVIGFYFEKRRVLAMSLATTGYSVGTMMMFPINAYFVRLSGWRWVLVFQSGLVALTYFLSLTYRPLLTITVEAIEKSSMSSAESVPSLKAKSRDDEFSKSKTERLIGAISITRYPTVAAVIKENEIMEATPKAGPSSRKSVVFKPLISSTISQQQLASMRRCINDSKVIKGVSFDEKSVRIPPKKRSFWARMFFWEKHDSSMRPLYRDDSFYDGKIQNLKAYKEHVEVVPEDERTGLEYQLAVTRTAAFGNEKEEKRLWFPTASKRILATMLDFRVMLKVTSFRVFCLSGFFWAIGFYVPFVFLTDRNKKAGVPSDYYVSLIAFSTICGRFLINVVMHVLKLNTVKTYGLGLILAGIATFFSNLSYTFAFQYFYCAFFGSCVSVVSSLRVLCLVDLYGLSNLTSATGILYMFLGFGCILSTPLAGELHTRFHYDVAFGVAGIMLFLSGFLVVWL